MPAPPPFQRAKNDCKHMEINVIDLTQLPPLSHGSHDSIEDGVCIMEAVAWAAGEPWSDRPKCVCRIIGVLLRSWNDSLPDDDRDALLRPLIPRLIGTKGSVALEQKRAIMCADWLMRVQTPAWLRLAGLIVHADALSSLPEITDFAQCPSLMPILTAVRQDANTDCDAIMEAAYDAARDAARTAVWGAATCDVSYVAACDAAYIATRDAARTVAYGAALGAVGDAAWATAYGALQPTRLELQRSTLDLVDRMIMRRADA